MKNIVKSVIIVTVNILLCLTATAQDKFTEGKQTLDGRTFETRFTEIDVNIMIVNSQLPQYKNGYPLPMGPTHPLMVRPKDMKVDTVVDRMIVYNVLKHKLEKLRVNGERITISYVFGQDGNVVDISSYFLSRNTLITPKELALIDKRLRKEVKASFKGPDYLNWPVIFFGRDISF